MVKNKQLWGLIETELCVSEANPNEGDVASLGLTVDKLQFCFCKFRIGEDNKHGVTFLWVCPCIVILHCQLLFLPSCIPQQQCTGYTIKHFHKYIFSDCVNVVTT